MPISAKKKRKTLCDVCVFVPICYSFCSIRFFPCSNRALTIFIGTSRVCASLDCTVRCHCQYSTIKFSHKTFSHDFYRSVFVQHSPNCAYWCRRLCICVWRDNQRTQRAKSHSVLNKTKVSGAINSVAWQVHRAACKAVLWKHSRFDRWPVAWILCRFKFVYVNKNLRRAFSYFSCCRFSFSRSLFSSFALLSTFFHSLFGVELDRRIGCIPNKLPHKHHRPKRTTRDI